MPPFRLAALAASGLTVLTFAAPAAAGAAPAERHCVVDVLGQEADGELTVSAPTCYRTIEQARADAAVPPGAAPSNGASMALAITGGTLSTHYDGFGFTGSSITISGSVCNGGYVNLSLTWRNRISSSINNCPVTRFYDNLNLGGTSEWMYGSTNLSFMNNRTESVQYAS